MYIICHYGEVGLKGKNRHFFEETLVENIKKALVSIDFEYVKRISGRIIIKLLNLDEKQKKIVISRLKKVFGLVHFSFADNCSQDIKSIEEAVLKMAQSTSFYKFRVRVNRSNKEFPFTSPEIEREIGAYILKKSKVQSSKFKQSSKNKVQKQISRRSPKPQIQSSKLGIKVDLENPDVTFYIEIVENGYVFLYTEKIQGLGGLPVGVSGKAVSLFSGGIDSPVASFYAMKRGIKIIFLHLYTHLDKKELEKIKNLVNILNQYQFHSTLYLVPYLEVQRKIFENKNTSLSCLLCKRMMLRIAQKIAFQEKAEAIIMGDSIGQVADQTLKNIGVIQEAVKLPIIRPVICEDKLDIIRVAQSIGTYNFSNIPEKFYCQKFMPFHPNTNASLSDVKREEGGMDIEKLISEAIAGSQKIIFDYRD